MRKDGLFIAVEVDDGVAADAALAAKLAEVCPVDIFAASRRQGRDRRAEPRRVRALPSLPRRRRRTGTVRMIKLYDDGALLA